MTKRKMRFRIWKHELCGRIARIFHSQEGVGTVEVVLLILVAVGLVLIFKTRITELVSSVFESITSRAGKI